MAVAFTVTYLFHADVDAQGGAYATGVLVLITSAAVAVTIHLWNRPLRWAFLLIALIFIYTTLLNICERPEGIKIASFFIFAIVVSSLISRALRSTELRISGIQMDGKALELLEDDDDRVIRLVARRPRTESAEELDLIDRMVRSYHSLSAEECIFFFEVERDDASDFEKSLLVTGERVGKHRILRAASPVVANAFAALLIDLEERTGQVPHAYFKWHEGNPVANLCISLFRGRRCRASRARSITARRQRPGTPPYRPRELGTARTSG